MLKYLIVTGVIAVIFYLLLYWRLRRYIPIARRIFGITRDLYRVTRGEEGRAPVERASGKSSGQDKGGKLVRCASCGTWIPAGRAVISRGSSASYCSTECLETGSAEPRVARKSAER